MSVIERRRYDADEWVRAADYDALRVEFENAHAALATVAKAEATAVKQLRGAVEALRLIAEDRVPYEDPAIDAAVPDAVREFARRHVGGQYEKVDASPADAAGAGGGESAR